MKAQSTRAVMEALGEGQALFVGGCVRNALLGREVEDIDIATKHTPEKVMDLLAKADIKTIPTGIDHGTVTAIIDKQGFEITTLRKDVETDGRRAVVAFSQSWEEDAQRRDFTMNTLLMNADGDVFDPTGIGLEDLKAGRVVFVGEAKDRIAEDILRILRFFRFHAMYGKGEADSEALQACKAYADKIPSLSKERITQEFFKIMSIDNPVAILTLMFENGILLELSSCAPPLSSCAKAQDLQTVMKDPAVKPQDDNIVVSSPRRRPGSSDGTLETLGHLCDFQMRYGLGFLAARLYALAGFSARNVAAMESLLLLPKVFKKDMQAIEEILKLPDLKDDHAVKVAVYKHGRVPTAQALMIELATDRVMNGYAPAALKIVQKWDIPDFPLTGEDLMKQGIPQGPALGAELSKREEAWIKNGFK